MITERQNEIWAMLTHSEKEDIKEIYNTQSEEAWDRGYDDALKFIFGKHNLTAQVEEKPKEPKVKVGDKVIVCGKDVCVVEYINAEYDEYPYKVRHKNGVAGYYPASELKPYNPQNSEESKLSVSSPQNCEIPTENGISDSKIQSESAEKSTKEDAYFAYRLDLAKEIAVAMIKSGEKPGLCSRAEKAVDVANEIVKRLKETEI